MTTTTDLPLVAGTWGLDPAHSAVSFTVRHLGVSKVRGRFTRFGAEVVVGDTAASSSVTATVDLASVDTGNEDRDTHVRSADILDVEKRPTLAFRSTHIEGTGTDWTVTGDATIGDVTKPLVLTVELGGIEEFPGGPRHAGFEATGQIRRSDYGVGEGLPAAFVSDVVKFELDLQLLEPTD